MLPPMQRAPRNIVAVEGSAIEAVGIGPGLL